MSFIKYRSQQILEKRTVYNIIVPIRSHNQGSEYF